MKPSLINLGPNLLCVIDTETTGVKPGWNEIIQLTVIPLDLNFEMHKDFVPFNQLIKPEYPERLYSGAKRMARKLTKEALKDGVDSYAASELFNLWFDGLQLGDGKVSPLATNWPFDAAMILEWLSPEHYCNLFHGHYRDLMCCASFWNDRFLTHGESVPFQKLSLGMIANKLEVPFDSEALHDSFYDCMLTAKCYKKLLTKFCVNF